MYVVWQDKCMDEYSSHLPSLYFIIKDLTLTWHRLITMAINGHIHLHFGLGRNVSSPECSMKLVSLCVHGTCPAQLLGLTSWPAVNFTWNTLHCVVVKYWIMSVNDEVAQYVRLLVLLFIFLPLSQVSSQIGIHNFSYTLYKDLRVVIAQSV
jgi:hypothetical protein